MPACRCRTSRCWCTSPIIPRAGCGLPIWPGSQWERSRVSHHVTRMESRRLVQRVECAEDGRGAFVVITPQGRAAIEQAAPGHVNTIRRLVFDALNPEEIDALATIIDKTLASLDNQAEGFPSSLN
jgi:DNA-binding MarR family transcriptional regulator